MKHFKTLKHWVGKRAAGETPRLRPRGWLAMVGNWARHHCPRPRGPNGVYSGHSADSAPLVKWNAEDPCS